MNSEGGKAVGTVLSMMQTRHRVGNVLFQHTPPTDKTLALSGDATLENNFSERIQTLLAGKSPFADSEERSHWVNQLNDWVYAGNRLDQIPRTEASKWKVLSERGISVLCFGHDIGSAGHESISTSEGKIELIGVDYRFGLRKRNEHDPECFSAAYFMPNGKVIVEIPAL